uniref:Uncharacterized protein n=1 Tax=Setaria viridis TaxID=4556 RepID=A0A4U6U963_SETVI|nr:hypothetical protein SEVIR_5G030700v2 [Setaria viridis]
MRLAQGCSPLTRLLPDREEQSIEIPASFK